MSIASRGSDAPDASGASEADDWNQRYVEGRTAWDLGGPPPALVRVIAAEPSPLRVLVPGAGRGHDAMAWAKAGHSVVAVDFAALAVKEAREIAAARGVALEVLEADVLALPDRLAGAFDLVWEQTCFCAIPVEHRPAYVRSMASALRPGGRLVALLWNNGRDSGPPFDVTREHVEALFPPLFTVDRISPVPDSVANRTPELLAELTRI